jgi:hypothetical protein
VFVLKAVRSGLSGRKQVLFSPKLLPLWTGLGAIAVFGSLTGCGVTHPIGAEAEARQAAQDRYVKAKALFEERCKTAGVVIKRTVKDVEGIELTKIRQPIPWAGKEYFDPMYPEAAMAVEARGDDYVKQFLVLEFSQVDRPRVRGQLGPSTIERSSSSPATTKGYAFVEFVDRETDRRYRCTPDWSLNHPNWVSGQHHCSPVLSSSARYSLDYEDVVDPKDRAFWIAGTKLTVVDKQSGEVIAQLTRFVWDTGFGASSGRLPWAHANSGASQVCPSDSGQPLHHDTRYFIDRVLVPKQDR